MYKLFLSISLFICSLLAGAQNMSVVSFQLNEQDLTANQQGTIVFDQNGEKCALIKVFTTETGFTFDVGSLGVAKTEQKVGEIWVYVPHGIKKINLSHPILQRLEYSIPIPIVKARTYEMRLTSDEVKTIIKRTVKSQYVLFKVSPQDALVELDDQTLAVTDGTATKRMPFGTYSYRVQAPRHAVKSGTIVVNDPKNKHIVNISLEPQYVNANFSVANRAEIWIDEQKRGTGSCTMELGYGTYLVECRLPGHKPSQQEIQIDRNSATGTITLTPPTPIYGSVDINSTPVEAEIWIDGKQVGTTPMFLSECIVGEHELLLKKSGYKDKKLNLLVSEDQTSAVSESLEREMPLGAVDLGLPSGTLWADRNVGADSPEDYGDYFAWGETSTKSTYNWSTYKWCRGSDETMTKYYNNSSCGTADNKTVLDLQDDAAYVNMGTEWRMPTYDELEEIKNKCTWTWTTQNGTQGYKVTGPKGKSIFLPAAGVCYDGSLYSAGSYGFCWSASLSEGGPNRAWYLGFDSNYVNMGFNYRRYGLSVRAVVR